MATLAGTVSAVNGIYTVHVTEPGTFGLRFLQVVGGEGATQTTDNDWLVVKKLTVTGNLNGEDLKYFYRMKNMTHLDVSGVSGIRTFSGCQGLDSLRSVVLSTEMTNIGEKAFYENKYLRNINLEHVDSVFTNAFYYCSRLEEDSLPNAKYIGKYAFLRVDSIKNVYLPVCETIEQSAFEYCRYMKSVYAPVATTFGLQPFKNAEKLQSVVISDNTTVLTSHMFASCSALKTFTFPSKLQSINSSAFSSAGLININLPEGLKFISEYAFSSVPFVTVSLPSTLQSVYSSSFSNRQMYDQQEMKYYYPLTDVYNYAVNPNPTKFFTSEASDATLHVPTLGIANYKLSESWYHFAHTVSLTDSLENVLISDEFYITSPRGLADKANLTVRPRIDPGATGYTTVNTWGKLTITSQKDDGNGNFIEAHTALGKYTQVQDLYYTSKNTRDDATGLTIY